LRIDHAIATSFPAVTKFTTPSSRTFSRYSFVNAAKSISHGSYDCSSTSSNAAAIAFSSGSRRVR